MRICSLILLLTLSCIAHAQIDPLLLTAIQQNNPASVQAALKANRTRPEANPNATDSLGATPLMWACYKADTTVVKLLIKAGASTQCRGVIRTDTSTYYGNLTGLAAGLNKLPLLRYLLETLKLPVNEPEYNPETKKNDGWTPAEWAAANGHLAVLTYLAQRGADLSVAKGNPMALAASLKREEILAFLLNQGFVLQKDNPAYGRVLSNYFNQVFLVANAYAQQGQYSKAIPLFTHARTIYSESTGREDANFANLTGHLARAYQRAGEYDRALLLYMESLAIIERVQGKQHPNYDDTLNILAVLYREMGQYEKALPLHLEGLAIAEHVYGKQQPGYAASLNNLAMLYQAMGQYDRALLLYQESQTIFEKAQGKQQPGYAANLNNLAALYREMGQYEKALPLHLEGLAIAEHVYGKQHPDYATSLNNLAALYQAMGQYEKLLPLYLEALGIIEKTQDKLHPNYAQSLNNLAALYQAMGQYEKALPLLMEALTIREKTQGKLHPDYATSLNNLAVLYQAMGQYEKVLPLFLEALMIREKKPGKLHPDYAHTLNNLGAVYGLMGQYEKALPLYLECLAIQEKALGKLHPDYAHTLNNLAALYQAMGQYEKALPLCVQARQQYRSQLINQIGVMNEATTQQFQSKFDFQNVIYSLGLTANIQALAGQHYTDALLSKGVGLLATQQLNTLLAQTKDTTTTRIASQMRATKQRINRQLTLPLSQQQGLDSLQRLANALEQQLVLRLPEYGRAFKALAVEWPQVQKALKPDEAAIEFVSFDYYHKSWTDSTFYMALVLRPGWATPKMVFLGEEKQLDSLIATGGSERRAAYVERLYTGADRGGVVANADGKPRPSLYSRVWQPIDSLLTGVKRVYYSPTGLLHRLNLAALPMSRSQRIADKYQLTLLASTRQLALPPDTRPTNTRALLMGNIRYDLDSLSYKQTNDKFRTSEGVASRSSLPAVLTDSSSRGGSFWDELQYTGQEVQIASGLLRNRGYQTDTLSGLAASEEAFYYFTRPSVGSPKVLHLATHGFFYDAPKSTTVPQGKAEPQPAFIASKEALVRSGLGLAGGNRAWERGRIPAGQEDGVLTAYEISLLDLHQTELVVLSACETGLGDLKGSEGVYGLQRAFKMAGVRNIIMSLWQVPDKATRILMEKFYGYYAGENQSVWTAFDRAVADVQALYSEPYFWAGFVLVE